MHKSKLTKMAGKLKDRLLQKRDWKSYALNTMSPISYKDWPKDFFLRFVVGGDATNGDHKELLIRRPTLLARYSNLYVKDLGDRMTANEIFCWECYKYKNKPGDTILDLGANTGISANYFLSLDLNNQCMLIEPNGDLKNDIKANLRQYSATRYEIKIAAVGPTAGKGTLNQTGHSRYSQLSYDHDTKKDVEVITLSSAIEECIARFGSCDVLKIDIEGLGFAALDTIPIDFKYKPRFILIEEENLEKYNLQWLRANYSSSRHTSGIHKFSLKSS